MIDWKNVTLRELAGFISKKLRQSGVEATLVGGACVSIYTENKYQSYDLDFICYDSMKKVKRVLTEIGLKEKNKYFYHEECPWFIEFVSPPVAIGNEPVFVFHQEQTPLGVIKMLTIEDCVKDRLAAFFHWNDQQSLAQAILICKDHPVDIENIQNWAIQERKEKEFEIFLNEITLRSI